MVLSLFLSATPLFSQTKQDKADVALAKDLQEAGKLPESLALLHNVLNRNPHYVLALHRRGMLYLQLEAYGQAGEDLKAAFDLQPYFSRNSLEYARLQFEMGNINEAYQAIRHCLDGDEELVEAHWVYVRILIVGGKYVDASKELKLLDELDPDNIDLLYYRARLNMDQGVFPPAIKYLRLALERDPANTAYLRELGQSLQFNGDYTEALDVLDRLITLNEASGELEPYVYYLRGAVRYALRLPDMGAPDSRKAIELNPSADYYYGQLALQLDELGQLEEAVVHQQHAIRLNPRKALHYQNLGWLYIQMDSMAAALAPLNQAIEMDPEDSYALSNRARVQLALGNLVEARRDIDAALALFRGHPMFHLNNARIYLAEGNATGACAALLEALDRGYTDQYDGKALALQRQHCATSD